MKKTAVIMAMAFGLLSVNVNASNPISTLKANTIVKTVEVSPLCKAVAIGDMATVKKLITNGVNVNAKSNGMLAIHYAAKYNRVDMIKVLITAGSEIHKPCDKGYTALVHAKKSKAKDAESFLRRFKK